MFVFCAIAGWMLRDHGNKILKHTSSMQDCGDENCTGHGIVFRITLGMTLVSAVMSVLLIRVRSANSPRAVLQNEFFALKWLALVGVIVGCVYLDNKAISQFAYASAVLSSGFLLFSIMILLEWAHGWNDSWIKKYDESGDKEWAVLILFCAFIIYGASVVMWWVIIQYFGGPGCDHTNAFISITIVGSVVLSVLSIIGVIQNGALLPSAVVTGYATYLCVAAVISIPSDNTSACANRHDRISGSTEQGVYAVGILFTILTTGYATIRAASHGESLDPTERAEVVSKKDVSAKTEEGEVHAEAEEDEGDSTEYNYSFFHIIYALGAMNLGMVLNNWDLSLTLKTETLGDSSPWTPTWVKIASQWAVFLLYLWTLIAPIICSGRDFS